MIEDHELDYASLATLLDRAAREHRDLAATSDDPLERYRARPTSTSSRPPAPPPLSI